MQPPGENKDLISYETSPKGWFKVTQATVKCTGVIYLHILKYYAGPRGISMHFLLKFTVNIKFKTSNIALAV